MSQKEDFIKDALFAFLRENDIDATTSSVDDIVLSYVVSILEELGTESQTAETFDHDDFTEMMDGYIPGFGVIGSSVVCEWIFKLAATLPSDEGHTKESTLGLGHKPTAPQKTSLPQAVPPGGKTGRRRKNSYKKADFFALDSSKKFSPKQRNDSENSVEEDDEIALLREMFPAACSVEISHCLGVSGGNVQNAAQLILYRQECGDSFTTDCLSQSSGPASYPRSEPVQDDKQMRDNLIQKYSYVDVDDDIRAHKPTVLPRPTTDKKLVRYLDSKIVSTKGERFTEIKRDTDLDTSRHHRFH